MALPSLKENYFWRGNVNSRNSPVPLSEFTALGLLGTVVPSGTTAQRPASPEAGMLRYNFTEETLELYNTSIWNSLKGSNAGVVTSITAGDGLTGGVITESGAITLGSVTLTGPVTGTAVIGATSTSIATSFADNPVFPGTESVRLPSGTTAQRPSSPVAGDFRYNSTIDQIEFYNGSSWVFSGAPGTITSITAGNGLTGGIITDSGAIALGGITLTGPVTGTAVIGATSTSVATSFADNPVLPGTESVTIPRGTTTQRPSSPVAGDFRYNNTIDRVEFYNGSSWIFSGSQGTVTSITAGNGLTGGTITESGTIALGAVTLNGAITGTAVIEENSTTIATSLADNPDLADFDYIVLPSGSTEQRPNPATEGALRANTTIRKLEYFGRGAWRILLDFPI